MGKPSEKNLSKMRTYAEKFAEKSGTYLHPDHGVTDVVVQDPHPGKGRALRHKAGASEEVAKEVADD